MRLAAGSSWRFGSAATGQQMSPIEAAFQARPQPDNSFDPTSLLVSPGSTNTWLETSPPPAVNQNAFKR
jgi:plastocyanin